MTNTKIYLTLIAIALVFTYGCCKDCICETDSPPTFKEDTIPLDVATLLIARYDSSTTKAKDTTNLFISTHAFVKILLQEQFKDIEGIFIKRGMRDDGTECELAFASMKHGVSTAPKVFILSERSCVCMPCCSGTDQPHPTGAN